VVQDRHAVVPEAPVVLQLVLRAQVDDGPQAQVEEQVQVLTVEPVQRVGPDSVLQRTRPPSAVA
jgi:hypothetical protein